MFQQALFNSLIAQQWNISAQHKQLGIWVFSRAKKNRKCFLPCYLGCTCTKRGFRNRKEYCADFSYSPLFHVLGQHIRWKRKKWIDFLSMGRILIFYERGRDARLSTPKKKKAFVEQNPSVAQKSPYNASDLWFLLYS